MATAPTKRILYRGALSLPDSHLLLDGLTFSLVGSHKAGESIALLLESMSGRPSLPFLGLCFFSPPAPVSESQSYVELTIHPDSTLSLIYFTSTASAAVRVGVGEEEEVLIYPDPTLGTIRVYPTDSFSSSSGPFSKSSTPLVATGTPPTNKNQVIGRPDDPTPRKVPPLFKVPSLPPPAAPPLLSLPVEDDENGRQREVIKKSIVEYLKYTTVTRSHPEYRELFGYVYKGVRYALRSEDKTDEGKINRLVKAHVDMYIPQ